MSRQIVLDTETTGLETEKGHRIIEIGCIELINRKLTGKTFHRYINPDRDIEITALSVHGITKTFLADKPSFCDIVHELLAFIRDAELIIHNASFDVGFLNYEFNLTKQKLKNIAEYCKIFDTLLLARQLHTGQRNSLDALCKRYGINNSDRTLHGALLDANLLAQVYLAMTGGQGSLFEELESLSTTNSIHISTHYAADSFHLPVIQPTTAETEMHELYLKKLAEKNRCVWNALSATAAG